MAKTVTTRTTEKFDSDGKLVERFVETITAEDVCTLNPDWTYRPATTGIGTTHTNTTTSSRTYDRA